MAEIVIVKTIEEMIDFVKNTDDIFYENVLKKHEELKEKYADKDNEPPFRTIDFFFEGYLREVIEELCEKYGKTVALIDEKDWLFKYYSNEKDIRISGDFKIIDYNCFRSCQNVENLVFEEGVEFINPYAAKEKQFLKSVSFPSTLELIGMGSFKNCPNLENVVIKNKDTCFSANSFENTKWLDSLKDEFVVVNGYLIKYNGNDKTVKIPEGVTNIASDVFSNNNRIEKVIFSKDVENVWANAFAQCENLKEVELNEGLKMINLAAFWQCNNVKKVKLPASLEILGAENFTRKTHMICYGENKELTEKIKDGHFYSYEIIEKW